MKNFIFISPNFPQTYWRFCQALRRNGLRVLGIGDCPYDELTGEQRNSMDEYYKVSTLENFDEVFRAVAFFTFKYGKIHWLESNNEYWLERDAHLRTEFHITTGFQSGDMERVRSKAAMKAYFARAGIPTARCHVIDDPESALAFAHQVGYPVVVKPDRGVGAAGTGKIDSDDALRRFLNDRDPAVPYLMEEFINGQVQTYDAIIDSRGEPIFESGNVTCDALMDVVNESRESLFYIVKALPDSLRELGRKTVRAFGVKSRFVHFEYFVLQDDQPGVGKKGDIFGLEVNMRPPGGIAPELTNLANSVDVYQIWADMVAFDATSADLNGPRCYCGFCGRRDGVDYAMGHGDILSRYGSNLKLTGRVSPALSDAMGDSMYVLCFDSRQALLEAMAQICLRR